MIPFEPLRAEVDVIQFKSRQEKDSVAHFVRETVNVSDVHTFVEEKKEESRLSHVTDAFLQRADPTSALYCRKDEAR